MTISLALLILSLTTILSAPIPQGAGVRQGCDAILTDADTGSGFAVKEAGQNAASLLKSAGVKRQGAGAGDACIAIGQLRQRQLDKAGAGTAAIIGVVDLDAAACREGFANNIDGDGTSDSATVGKQVGAFEAEAGEGGAIRCLQSFRQLLEKPCLKMTWNNWNLNDNV